MSLTSETMSPADIAAVMGNNGGRNNGDGMFGNDWAWIVILLLFGWGGRGFGGGFGGGYGAGAGYGAPCATQADVRAAVDQQTLISKIDQQTYGMADSFNSLNNTINGNFRTLDGAICNLGYQALQNTNALQTQLADCCCTTQQNIERNTNQGILNTNALSRQLADCCCAIEKDNMQSRFDAQAYNCNTLQAIDKLGDRIIDHLTQDKIATLTADNQALRFAASQSAQNAYLVSQLKEPCAVPAYVVPNPNCCYGNPYGVGYGFNNSGCGCGNNF